MTRNLSRVRTRFWLALVCLAFGCGGSLAHALEVDAVELEAGDFIEAGAVAECIDAGASPRRTEEESASPAVDVAVKARDARLIESGTRTCVSREDCLGLDCEFGPTPLLGACVVHCAADVDCQRGERCFGMATAAKSCMATCNVRALCAYGFDCVDYDRDDSYTCLPTTWVAGPPP
jgi:hypothetical protein